MLINFLPWRETIIKKQKKMFLFLLLSSIALSIFVMITLHVYINQFNKKAINKIDTLQLIVKKNLKQEYFYTIYQENKRQLLVELTKIRESKRLTNKRIKLLKKIFMKTDHQNDLMSAININDQISTLLLAGYAKNSHNIKELEKILLSDKCIHKISFTKLQASNKNKQSILKFSLTANRFCPTENENDLLI